MSKKKSVGKAAGKKKLEEEIELPNSIDRDARIECGFPEWDMEYVNQLIAREMSRIGATDDQEVEEREKQKSKKFKNAVGGKQLKVDNPPAKEFDFSVIDFEPKSLELEELAEEGELIWKPMHERGKIRLLRSRVPKHPYFNLTIENGIYITQQQSNPNHSSIPEESVQSDRQLLQDRLQQLNYDYEEYTNFPRLLHKGPICRAFESVLYAVKHHHRHIPLGHYMWECIFPKVEGSAYLPAPSPFGKYIVKVWYMGAYRIVIVDDLLPYTGKENIMIFPETRRNELWPAIIFKALLKIAAKSGVERQVFQDPLFTLQALLPGYTRLKINSREQLLCLRHIRESFQISQEEPPSVFLEKDINDLQHSSTTQQRIICATVRQEEDIADELKLMGLDQRRIYLVERVSVHDGQPLLRMLVRKAKWKGLYRYDAASVWTAEFEESVGYARQDQITSPLHVNDFWITYTEFTKNFEGIHVFYDTSVLSHHINLFGENLKNEFYACIEQDTRLAVRVNRIGHQNNLESNDEQQSIDSSEDICFELSVDIFDWKSKDLLSRIFRSIINVDSDVGHLALIHLPTLNPMDIEEAQNQDSNDSSPSITDHISIEAESQKSSVIVKFSVGDAPDKVTLELLSSKKIQHIGDEREVLRNGLGCVAREMVQEYPEHSLDGQWRLWFMKRIQVEHPFLFSSTISIPRHVSSCDILISSVEYGLVNLATGEYTTAGLNRIQPIELQPNDGSGFILVAHSKPRLSGDHPTNRIDEDVSDQISAGMCNISIICSDGVDFATISNDISTQFPVDLVGSYTPNPERELFRYEIWTGEPCYSMLYLELLNRVSVKFQILHNDQNVVFESGISSKRGIVCVPPMLFHPSTKTGTSLYTLRAILDQDIAQQQLEKRLEFVERKIARLVEKGVGEISELPLDPEEEERRLFEVKQQADLTGKQSGKKGAAERKGPTKESKKKGSNDVRRIPTKQDKPQIMIPQPDEVEGMDCELDDMIQDILSFKIRVLFSSPNVLIEKMDPRGKTLDEYKEQWSQNKEPGGSETSQEARQMFYNKIMRQEYIRLKGLPADEVKANDVEDGQSCDSDQKASEAVMLNPARAKDPEWLKRGTASWLYQVDTSGEHNDTGSVTTPVANGREEQSEVQQGAIDQVGEIRQGRAALQEAQQQALRESEEQLKVFHDEMRERLIEQQQRRAELVRSRLEQQQGQEVEDTIKKKEKAPAKK